MKKQRTIKNDITFQGIGLHSGKMCTVTLRPANADTGIVFFRTDRGIMIKLHPGAVVDTAFATTIGYNGTRIKTIEHILSALSAFEIDNVCIDIEGPEIPILDGSSFELAEILLKAGIEHQNAYKKVLEILHPFSVSDGLTSIEILPYQGRKFSQTIEFHNQFLGRQEYSIDLTPEAYMQEIAPARTFGFLKDVEMLRQNGLAKGGSLENAVVIDGNRVINPSGLRYKDEFVRHKILDCIGDMYLCGIYIRGHIISERSGHSTNVKFLKQLLLAASTYRIQPYEASRGFMPAQA